MTKAQKIVKREALVLSGFLVAAAVLYALKKYGPEFYALSYIILLYCYPAHIVTKIVLWMVRKNMAKG